MTVSPILLPRFLTLKVLRLTFAWAILTVHSMGVGIALVSSLDRVMGAFQTWWVALGYMLYLLFIAPYGVARVASTFLRSMLARESIAATAGLIVSLLLEIAWGAILVRDLNVGWDP
jgi:hypothetical protein